MTVNDCLRGVAAKLRALWPEQEVRVGGIAQDAPGKCLVRCNDQSHGRGLDRRRRRSYGFEVLWFPRRRGAEAFHDWAEAMYGTLEAVEAGGVLLHCADLEAKDTGDGVWHFTFSVKALPLLEPAPVEIMRDLDVKERMKDG